MYPYPPEPSAPIGYPPQPSAPIGFGAAPIVAASEYFNPATPVNIPINGFVPGRRIRIVGMPTHHAERFQVNLMTPSDNAFHFNPRFDEHCVVRNNTRYSEWQHEERAADHFPFQKGQMFTIEFIAFAGYYDVLCNGRFFTRFNERDNSHNIRSIQIEGDVHIHYIHISP